MAKYKPPFKIGDWVKVKRVAVPVYINRYNRKIESSVLEKEAIGQICGAVYRYEGKRDPGYSGTGFLGDYGEPPSWTAQKAHLLWQIKASITGKPIEAFEKDVEPIKFQEYIYPPLPFRPLQEHWGEKYPAAVEELRENMKHWARDEKGRFKAYVNMTQEERDIWRKRLMELYGYRHG
jgi:hypothetical protein